VSLVLAMIAFGPASGFAQTDRLPGNRTDDVKQLESRLSEAYIHSDVAVLDSLLAPDYVSVNGKGLVRNRQQILEDFRSGVTRFFSVTDVHKEFRIEGDDTVVVIGNSRVDATDRGGRYTGTFQLLRVWKRDTTGWKAIVSQSFTR